MEKFEELVIENPETIKGGQNKIVIEDEVIFVNGIVIEDQVLF